MRNTIVIDVDQIYLTDFENKLTAPALIEGTESGVRILFNDIDELSNYQESLLLTEDETEEAAHNNELKAKLKGALQKMLQENQVVLKAIKAYAHALFSFIFDAEAHRQDKIAILDTMVDGMRATTNSWELEKSIQESTYELGIPVFNHKLTFYNFAHNQLDFNYEKIKSRLIKDLLVLKLELK